MNEIFTQQTFLEKKSTSYLQLCFNDDITHRVLREIISNNCESDLTTQIESLYNNADTCFRLNFVKNTNFSDSDYRGLVKEYFKLLTNKGIEICFDFFDKNKRLVFYFKNKIEANVLNFYSNDFLNFQKKDFFLNEIDKQFYTMETAIEYYKNNNHHNGWDDESNESETTNKDSGEHYRDYRRRKLYENLKLPKPLVKVIGKNKIVNSTKYFKVESIDINEEKSCNYYKSIGEITLTVIKGLKKEDVIFNNNIPGLLALIKHDDLSVEYFVKYGNNSCILNSNKDFKLNVFFVSKDNDNKDSVLGQNYNSKSFNLIENYNNYIKICNENEEFFLIVDPPKYDCVLIQATYHFSNIAHSKPSLTQIFSSYKIMYSNLNENKIYNLNEKKHLNYIVKQNYLNKFILKDNLTVSGEFRDIDFLTLETELKNCKRNEKFSYYKDKLTNYDSYEQKDVLEELLIDLGFENDDELLIREDYSYLEEKSIVILNKDEKQYSLFKNIPIKVSTLSLGINFCFIITVENCLYSQGYNTFGVLGLNISDTTFFVNKPTLVTKFNNKSKFILSPDLKNHFIVDIKSSYYSCYLILYDKFNNITFLCTSGLYSSDNYQEIHLNLENNFEKIYTTYFTVNSYRYDLSQSISNIYCNYNQCAIIVENEYLPYLSGENHNWQIGLSSYSSLKYILKGIKPPVDQIEKGLDFIVLDITLGRHHTLMAGFRIKEKDNIDYKLIPCIKECEECEYKTLEILVAGCGNNSNHCLDFQKMKANFNFFEMNTYELFSEKFTFCNRNELKKSYIKQYFPIRISASYNRSFIYSNEKCLILGNLLNKELNEVLSENEFLVINNYASVIKKGIKEIIICGYEDEENSENIQFVFF